MPKSPPDEGRQSAVALAYDPHEPAPRVVAKGYGTIAENIVRVAQTHGLYVHESPELVGMLMQVDLDAHIPPTLYVAIAELLAWLYQLDSNHPEGQDDLGALWTDQTGRRRRNAASS